MSTASATARPRREARLHADSHASTSPTVTLAEARHGAQRQLGADEALPGERQGKAEQRAHDHHAADRSDAEDQDVREGDRRVRDGGQHGQHERGAPREPVDETDQERAPHRDRMVLRVLGARRRRADGRGRGGGRRARARGRGRAAPPERPQQVEPEADQHDRDAELEHLRQARAGSRRAAR